VTTSTACSIVPFDKKFAGGGTKFPLPVDTKAEQENQENWEVHKMGWTWQCAKFYDRRGSIDRKAECDDLYTWNNEETGDKCRVLKSAMVGATWYGACERSRPGQEPYVFAGVCLTSVDSREYCNFGYKDMDESMGPCERDCPVSILNLLSHRDDEWALEWREDCRNNAAQKATDRKNPNSLQNLPLGAKITVQKRGQNIVLEKGRISNRKNPVWISRAENVYYPLSHIKRYGYKLCVTA
jgi:hypothetical protein